MCADDRTGWLLWQGRQCGGIDGVIGLNEGDGKMRTAKSVAIPFAFGLVVATLGLAWPTPAQADLVGYWNFDEGSGTIAADFSPNANDGTLGGAKTPTWVPGVRGTALNFDYPANGATSFVYVPASATLGASPWSNFTIAAWVNEQDNNWSHIFVTTNDHANREWLLQGDNGAGSMYVWSDTNGNWKRPLGWAQPDNSWHHVAVTYDGSKMESYLDGTSMNTQNFSTTFGSFPSAGLYLGGWLANWSTFEGACDDMIIFNSVEDIGSIMDGTHQAMNPEPPPPSGIPEPATLTLFGLGAVGLLIRRKRS